MPVGAQQQPDGPPLLAPQRDDQADTGSPDLLAGLEPPKPTTREIGASVDYLLGKGDITVPIFFSMAALDPRFVGRVETADRESDYLGGTLSFSVGQKWYIDLSYQQGDSSGQVGVPLIAGGDPIRSSFTVEDTWYQAYVRYAFPGLRGKRLSAYLRVGVSYVDTSMRVQDDPSGGQDYVQKNEAVDKLGNLGFGVGYSLYAGTRTKWNLQMEGEAFYGLREQESDEMVVSAASPRVELDNDLYGAIGRATVRFEYGLGRTGLLKVLADAGMQVKTSRIEYEELGDKFSELLWGPYAKVGLSYSF